MAESQLALLDRPKPEKPKNVRRYNPDWELSYSWVTSVVKDSREVPFCNVCSITLSTHRSCLNKHGKSLKHNEILNKQKQTTTGSSSKTKSKPAKRGLIVSFKNSHNVKSSRTRITDIPTSTRDDLPTLVRRINRLPPSIQDELPATMNNINSKSPAKQGQSKIIKTENEVVVKKRKLSNDEVERNESRAFCPRETVVKLGKFMYDSDWAVGNGGGITIRDGENLYMEPSCVAKDRIKVEDLFVTDLTGKVLSHPDNEALKLTQCSPLFMNAYLMRDAGAVIHSHAQCACLATLICKGAEFCISHLEMLKGIKKATTGLPYNYDEVLKIPIIENTLFEKELKNRMQVAMDMYPDTNAVLVRRHGVYIWGDSWEQAKSMAECYHYLFKMALEMHRMGMKFDVEPTGESGFTD